VRKITDAKVMILLVWLLAVLFLISMVMIILRLGGGGERRVR
jgi:hypothetical protein